jgi:hypothetical protein
MTTLTVQQEKNLNQQLRETGEFPEALPTAQISVSDTSGLYDVMLNDGPITSACLATQAGIPERLARRWLNVQVDGNRLGHHAPTGLYGLWCAWPAQVGRVC